MAASMISWQKRLIFVKQNASISIFTDVKIARISHCCLEWKVAAVVKCSKNKLKTENIQKQWRKKLMLYIWAETNLKIEFLARNRSRSALHASNHFIDPWMKLYIIVRLTCYNLYVLEFAACSSWADSIRQYWFVDFILLQVCKIYSLFVFRYYRWKDFTFQKKSRSCSKLFPNAGSSSPLNIECSNNKIFICTISQE